MFELKPLSEGGIEAALRKAVRYRLLNEPFEAESICLDILGVDADNQQALTTLVLALTDQFGHEGGATVKDAQALIPQLKSAYDRNYYAGIICERRGEAYLRGHSTGTGPIAYDWLRKAMSFYEEAERLSPGGNDDPILRWNTCARLINRYEHLRPSEPHRAPVMLE